MSLLIRGGRVVTADEDAVADVLVEGDTIVAVGASPTGAADRVIDATGKLVLPGGIDVHTHMETPSDGLFTCDDFRSGTEAAAFGGTTTIIDFATQFPGRGILETLDEWKRKIADRGVWVDVGLHMILTELPQGEAIRELELLCTAGVPSYKLFMAFKGSFQVDDEALFRTARAAAAYGALLLVHAENGDVIDLLQREAVAAGHRTPEWHARTRPPELEAEATARALRLAQLAGAPIYVVHVSCRQAIDEIALARSRGWAAWGETCPQYLHVDESRLQSPGFEGAKYVYSPPPRPVEHQAHLWSALRDDTLSVVSTDHTPYTFAGQKSLGAEDFTLIPAGAPGVETRLPFLYDHGVRGGQIGLRRFVELVSANPAKLFGMFPRKGTVAVGSDADLVVWDPEASATVAARTHHSKADYSLFEGLALRGIPRVVIARGRVIVDDGRLLGEPSGRFLPRERFLGRPA